MQINPVSNSYNTSFNAVVRTHLTSGATAKVTVLNNEHDNIKEISYEIWHKGKMLKQIVDHWLNVEYDKILQSDYFSRVCKKLELTDEEDERKLNDAVFDAYIDEKKGVDEEKSEPDDSDISMYDGDFQDEYSDDKDLY